MNDMMSLLFGFGPTTRPRARWTPILLFATGLLAMLVLADAASTILCLTDTNHPYMVEAVGPSAAIIEIGGWPLFVLMKLGQVAVVVAIIEYSRRRGLPRTALAVALVGVALYALVVANNVSLLLAPPTLI